MTPQQQQQLSDAQKRADALERNGHSKGSIDFTLRQEGYAEAVLQEVLSGVKA